MNRQSCTIALIAALSLSAVIVCITGCGSSTQDASERQPEVSAEASWPIRVSSPDERISVTLPVRTMVVHGFQGAISAVSSDGAARYFFEYLGEGELLKVTASAKDRLAAQGWEIDEQRHFETAVYIRWRRGGRMNQPVEVRECWWLSSGKALVSCEAQHLEEASVMTGEAMQAMCQSIEVSRLVGTTP